jgi:protein O-GlcNAc transferase
VTRPHDTESALKSALQHYQQGDLQKAVQFATSVLQREPEQPDALHILGIVAYRTRQHSAAATLIARAIERNPRVVDYHNNLCTVLRELGRFEESASRAGAAIGVDPGNALARNNLGLALRELGRGAEAVAAFREALRLNPGYTAARNHLGIAFQDACDFDAAIDCFRAVLQAHPSFADAHNNLGYALQRRGEFEEALRCYAEALRLRPDFAEAHNNLGTALQECHRTEQALAEYNEALRLRPDYLKARLNAGIALREQGRAEEAVAEFRRALDLHPGSLAARWGRCMAEIPCVYDSPEDITAARARYSEALEKLCGSVPLASPAEVRAAADAAGSVQPFYLAFQIRNDRDLQARYGALVSRIQAARYPPPVSRPASAAGRSGAIRVGIASAFFHQHSNWKLPIRGWLENLDRSRFELYGYYTGHVKDGATQAARNAFARFHEDASSVAALHSRISEDRPDVLIYPELGMDPTCLRLAALRLAPVQCTSWGHPDTSGLPTVDYYLSSELMEPPDGDSHYTEQLVRLPNLSVHYVPPEWDVPSLDRAALGLRDSAVVYSCVHSLLTYLPQYDDVFVRIAREVGDSQFVFLAFSKSSTVTDRFQSRLERAFRREGLRSEDHLVFLPHMDQARFQAVQKVCDTLLDSIGWSACNTTFEAITWNLPVVTLPGEFMRCRHACAILRMMGVTETIAGSVDDFVRLGIRLGKDMEFRHAVAARIAGNKHRIYRDTECIRGLELFLEKAVGSSRTG